MSVMTVPRGNPGSPPMSMDMQAIHDAENRLYEIRAVTPDKAPELMGYFNVACNLAGKYIAWIKYEALNAKKNLDVARATVILDKSVEAFEAVKDKGVKYNEDFRAAMIARDPDCQSRLDTLNTLIAAEALLESKFWSFMRAFNACRDVAQRRQMVAASPNLSTGLMEEPTNYMGSGEGK